jgi:hypothetical protein
MCVDGSCCNGCDPNSCRRVAAVGRREPAGGDGETMLVMRIAAACVGRCCCCPFVVAVAGWVESDDGGAMSLLERKKKIAVDSSCYCCRSGRLFVAGSYSESPGAAGAAMMIDHDGKKMSAADGCHGHAAAMMLLECGGTKRSCQRAESNYC